MSSRQQQPAITRNLVEEKHYRVPFDEGVALAREAISSALGVELVELAPGMWTGTKRADDHSDLEITVRALATDTGTSVEIQLENRFNAKAITLFTVGIVLGCVLIVPLIPTIIVSNRVNRQNERLRLVEMHKAWTEVGRAMSSPSNASYRDEPRRAYAPVRVAATASAPEPDEAVAPEAEPGRAQRA